MPKTSAVPTDSTPSLTDLLLGYDPETGLTDKQTIQTILDLLFTGSSKVTTYTNPGSAGGTNTFFYANIGGIKIFWGKTAAIATINGTTAAQGVTYPVGFFTTVQLGLLNTIDMTGIATQYATIASNATTDLAIYVTATGIATTKVSVLCIGT